MWRPQYNTKQGFVNYKMVEVKMIIFVKNPVTNMSVMSRENSLLHLINFYILHFY